MKQANIIRNRKEYLIKALEFHYDNLNDLLYVYRKESKVFSNVVIGEFHLEFNKHGELVGLEILKASDILSEYGIAQKLLENLNKVELRVVTNNNSLIVFLILNALNQEKTAAITMNNLESPINQVIAST